MSLYENVFIARQDVSSAQVDGLVENFEKIISDLGGSVSKKELWGLRTMAYKIKKNRKGHYVLMNIDAPSEAIQELERQMNLNEDVLRYLTTKVDELEEGPTAIMRAKERGDDRERREIQDDESIYSDESDIILNPMDNIESTIINEELVEVPIEEELDVMEEVKGDDK